MRVIHDHSFHRSASPMRGQIDSTGAVERTVDVVGTLKGWEHVTIGTKKAGRVAKVHRDIGVVQRVLGGARLGAAEDGQGGEEAVDVGVAALEMSG